MFLYNDAVASLSTPEDRLNYILKRANLIADGEIGNVPKVYRDKLKWLLKHNKIEYVTDYMRPGIHGYDKPMPAFGTATFSTQTIRLTSLIWYNLQSNEQLLVQEIDYVIVHETFHLVKGDYFHKKYDMDNVLMSWGFSTYYYKYHKNHWKN